LIFTLENVESNADIMSYRYFMSGISDKLIYTYGLGVTGHKLR